MTVVNQTLRWIDRGRGHGATGAKDHAAET